MKTILVTNDDGVQSEGIIALAAGLRRLGQVVVVAPAKEASAVGHALTLHYPLRLEQLGPRVFAVDGTPTDCVNIAVAIILKGLPDLIVSGINKGWNLGDDVTYSGTVSGALEGALLGVPSIAVSLQRTRERPDFRASVRAAVALARRVLVEGLPPRTFLNVNVPRVTSGRFRMTVQARRNHVTQVQERVDPKHRTYYWIDEAVDEWERTPDSDYAAARDGYVSVTPLQPDMTAYDAMADVGRLVARASQPKARPSATRKGGKKGLGAGRRVR